MVVEIDKLVNQFSGMLKRGDFLLVDAFGLKDGEEIFRHDCYGIVIPVKVYHMIFYFFPHPLPPSSRKSRSSWFSIRSLLSSAASL